jgi:hypothetical protein
MKNGDAAACGQKWRARPPLELRIIGGPHDSLLLSWGLCTGRQAYLGQQEQQRAA